MEIDDIKKIGVAGAGTMGHGIALNFALSGYPVTLCDINDDILNNAQKNVQKVLGIFIEEKLIKKEEAEIAAGNISVTTNLEELSRNGDFITEAIVERSEDKRQLFNRLDNI